MYSYWPLHTMLYPGWSVTMSSTILRASHGPSPGAGDGLLLGLAQACALVPGVSRNGATLTAARARRFTREQAHQMAASTSST